MISRYLPLLALVSLAVSDHISDQGRSVFLKVSDDPKCSGLYSCKDCNTAMLCKPIGPGHWEMVTTIPCPSSLPYCDYGTGTCTSSPDPACGLSDHFICPAESGHYPDPTNSTHYHVCENYLAKKFACASDLVYDPLAQDCRNETVGRAQLSCGPDGRKVPFPEYPTYFAYCSDKTPTIVDRCEGDYELNVTSQACEATCHGDGVLRDFEDCTKYYLCSTLYFSDTLSVTVKTRMSCPSGQGYNPAIYMCGPLGDIEGCTGPSPTTTAPGPTPTASPPSPTPTASSPFRPTTTTRMPTGTPSH